MNIEETRSDAVVVLALSGKLDGLAAPELESRVDRLFSENVKRLIFDCSALEYISSAGLRLFLATARRLQSTGGRCGFAALRSQVQQAFRLSNFLVLLEIHDTVADACR